MDDEAIHSEKRLPREVHPVKTGLAMTDCVVFAIYPNSFIVYRYSFYCPTY